jgi:type I restriction enzyme S subunit
MNDFLKHSSSKYPSDWNITNIGNVSNVIRGASPRPQGDPRYYGGSIPRLMGKDVNRDGKYVTPKLDYLTEEGAAKSRFLPAGSLVMICSGEVGVPAILAIDACIHDGFLAFQNISHSCNKEYLYYIFDSLKDEFNKSATHGGVFTNLTTSIIKEFKIPLPPLPEQQKIAEILFTVDEKIELIEAQINQTTELKKGLMQQLLTKGIGHIKFKDCPLGKIPESWEAVKLGELSEKVGSGITPKGGHEAYVERGVVFIRSQNVLRGKLDLSDVVFISEDQHIKMSNSWLRPNDVLLNITGASIGRSCIVPDDMSKGNVNQHVCIIRPNEKIIASYLSQLLNSKYGIDQIDKFQAGGNREGLNYQQIRSFVIPLPPKNEQLKIAGIVGTIDKKLESLELKRNYFNEFKKGLMQQLLTGKLRVNLNPTNHAAKSGELQTAE